jgi:chromosome segregation ATPase
VNADQPADLSYQAESLSELVAITQVVERRPVVELFAPQPFVPIAAKENERVNDLKGDLEKLGATLQETQKAVADVAKQRDEAREEVRALAKANHEMLNEMKAFRTELETARADSEKWKEHAAKMERKAEDQALANAALQQFRAELEGTMKDFQAMKGDIAKAREEFADPIERANLKEELAASKAKQARLGDEIEMALIAREKTIQETAQTRKELEGKMAALTQQVQEGNDLRDELRSANAVKMKALADVEVLRKGLTEAEAGRAETLAKLDTAQNGLTALQAEKAAAMEAKAVAMQERDAAQAGTADLQKQVDAALEQLDSAKNALAETNGRLKVAQQARTDANLGHDSALDALAALQDKMDQTGRSSRPRRRRRRKRP